MKNKTGLDRRAVASGLAVATLPTSARAGPGETLAERAAALLPHAFVAVPPGDGPFPAVLLMHGCGGCKPFQRTYAQALQAAGCAAVVIDSFAHRGLGTVEAYATVCTGLRLRGAARAGDLFALAAWAKTQTWADPARLIAAGWSHGGWTVMDALALRPDEMAEATGLSDLPEEPLAGLAAAFLVYPYCGLASLSDRRGWRFYPPTTAIVAGQDRIVGARRPQEVLQALADRGAAVDLRLFPEATHSFDEPEARDLRVRYSPERADETRRLLIAAATATP